MKHFSAENTASAIAKTTRMLVQQGVTVTNRGSGAFIEWNKKTGKIHRINLPMIPRDASEEFLAALQGYLDHEVAHAFNTEPLVSGKLEEAFVEESRQDNRLVRGMVNIIEDVRIEACMERDFRGSAVNLHNTRKFFSANFTKPGLEKITEEGSEADAARRSYVYPIYFRARGGQSAMIDFMDDNNLWPLMEGVDKHFPDMSVRLKALKSSADAAELAFEVIRAVCEPIPPKSEEPEEPEEEAPPPPEPECDDNDADDDEGDGEGEDTSGDADATGDAEADGTPEEDTEEGDAEGEGSGAEEPVNEDDAGDEYDAETEPEESTHGSKVDSTEDTGDGDSVDAEASDETGDAEAGEIEPADEPEDEKDDCAFNPETLEDFDEAMAKVLEDAIGEFESSEPYLIYTRDLDRIEPAKISNPPPSLDRWETDVEKTTGVMRRELQRLIAARTRSQNVAGFRRGRLHPGSLHRIMTGDDRVFSRKQEAVQKHTAFSLVVDLSASMSGGKLRVALQSAWAFADTLDRLGVPCEVIGFTTCLRGARKLARSDAEKIREFSRAMGISSDDVRIEPLYMPVFKGFDDSFGIECKRKLASAEDDDAVSLQQNIDGESIRIAAARLHQRSETRKIMMVFSDGHPCSLMNNSSLGIDLKKAVTEVTAAGIETIGIGIQSDAVIRYYPKSLVIKNVDELATTTMRQLKEILAS